MLRKVSVFSNIAFNLRTFLKTKLAVGQMLRFLSVVGSRSDVCFVCPKMQRRSQRSYVLRCVFSVIRTLCSVRRAGTYSDHSALDS